MAVEQARGCGHRKVGGLYLCGEGKGMACDRLPYELVVCPVCGEGVKFSRGFQWLDWYRYAGLHKDVGNCACSIACPICHPEMRRPLVATAPEFNEWKSYGLLWVGEAFYSPESFIKEAIEMGVSKRIAAIPKKLKLGKTWVLFAHKKAAGDNPGVFYAFRPQRLEFLIWRADATDEKREELIKKGITAIVIPDGDIEHDPNTKLKVSEEEHNGIESTRRFEGLRNNLRR